MNQDPILFVYGTLRAGYHNHHLLHKAKPLGLARTLQPRVMLAKGIPFLHRSTHSVDSWGVKEQAPRVWGEVYQLPWEQLRRVDMLEGHPKWYRRMLEPVELEGSTDIGSHSLLYGKIVQETLRTQGTQLKAWAYFITTDGQPVEVPAHVRGPLADYSEQ